MGVFGIFDKGDVAGLGLAERPSGRDGKGGVAVYFAKVAGTASPQQGSGPVAMSTTIDAAATLPIDAPAAAAAIDALAPTDAPSAKIDAPAAKIDARSEPAVTVATLLPTDSAKSLRSRLQEEAHRAAS